SGGSATRVASCGLAKSGGASAARFAFLLFLGAGGAKGNFGLRLPDLALAVRDTVGRATLPGNARPCRTSLGSNAEAGSSFLAPAHAPNGLCVTGGACDAGFGGQGGAAG